MGISNMIFESDVPQRLHQDEKKWVHQQVHKKTWMVNFPYKTNAGEIRRIPKQGFATEQEAVRWIQDFKLKKATSRDMLFRDFIRVYCGDKGPHFRESIFAAKENIIETMLLPYLGQMRLSDITGMDILQWQNEVMRHGDPKTGEPISRSYFRAVNRQLSEVFDHAVRFYGLPKNPVKSVAPMYPIVENEMKPRNDEDFRDFAECFKENPLAYSCFEALYWSGIRAEELLALTRGDIDFKEKIIYVRKTLRDVNGGGIAAVSRPLMNTRRVRIPDDLCEKLRDHIRTQGRSKRSARLFPVTKELSLAEG